MSEKRPRGRPKASEPGSSVSIWVPARQHDHLAALARQRGVSISALVRRVLSVRASTPSNK
ncbi:MAG: hypothetical protein OEW98_00110 [Betaproteobacteria bacterium]|nr:hypothetical protein [Betaproteobacteria bacterium]